MEKFKVALNDANQRLDKYLRKALPNNELGSIYKAFRKKDVKVNGKPSKPEYIVQFDDEIIVYLKRKMEETTMQLPIIRQFKVIFEDENLLIVSKPSGVSVQEDVTSKGKSLARQVLGYLQEKQEYDPQQDNMYVPSPVHRIDRNTTGLVLFAKNFAASQTLTDMLKRRTNIDKYYLALVVGKVDATGDIQLSLEKDETTSQVRVSKHGQSARTKYQCIQTNEEFSLVEAQIITGRTHQIRVHFAAIGHPIVGDSKYGDFEINGKFAKNLGLKTQFLHAYKLKFSDISGRFSYLNNREFIADLPEDKKQITAYIFGKK